MLFNHWWKRSRTHYFCSALQKKLNVICLYWSPLKEFISVAQSCQSRLVGWRKRKINETGDDEKHGFDLNAVRRNWKVSQCSDPCWRIRKRSRLFINISRRPNDRKWKEMEGEKDKQPSSTVDSFFFFLKHNLVSLGKCSKFIAERLRC